MPIALDTNIVVRLLVRDDPVQAAIAIGKFRGDVFVSHGVLMETEWVLRGNYRWDRKRTNAALAALLELENVEVALRDQIASALDYHARGADWADMLHLIAANGCSAFATFDKRVEKFAKGGPVKVELLR